MHRSRLVVTALLVGAAVLLGARAVVGARSGQPTARHVAAVPATPTPSSSPTPSPTPPPPPPDPNPIPTLSQVADAAVSSVPVYASPTVGPVTMRIRGRNDIDQTQAFLVVNQVPGWYQVELPVKPNESVGWIQAASVTLRSDPDYLRVSQSQFLLQHYVNGQLQDSFRVAVGAPSTPTPNGHFYVWASQPYAGAPYTPGIFALSGFSPVLDNWPGGGRTGIHGWTDTRVMGTRASHGCVRVAPADFARLLGSVPLGTPVDILP